MKVAVTGASGLVGTQVVRSARAAGHDVRAVVRRPATWSSEPDVEVVQGDLADPAAMARAVRGCEAVVHCAAVYAFDADRAAEVQRVNTAGTRSLLEAAAAQGVRRVLVTTSSVTRGSSTRAVPRTERDELGDEPLPAYYASKVEQERIALEVGAAFGLEVVLALPAVVLGGPTTHLLPSNAIVQRYLLDVTRSTYPGGCCVVDARDVGDGHVLLLERGEPGTRYLLGGQNLSWRTLHATVAELAGLPGPFGELPRPVVQALSAMAESWARLTSSAPLSTRDEASTVGRFYWYDHTRAAELGYAPRSGREALASALAWLVVGPEVPRWVREGLTLAPDVRVARPLVPRRLPSPG